jgi:serine/threonine protein kinase
VYGCCPFIAETEFELFNIISRKTPNYQDSVPGRDFVSEPLKDLLSRLLEKDVGKRITLKEVKVKAVISKCTTTVSFYRPIWS